MTEDSKMTRASALRSSVATGTLLRMEHAGFASDQDAAYKGANYGWGKFLGNLEQVVARLQ